MNNNTTATYKYDADTNIGTIHSIGRDFKMCMSLKEFHDFTNFLEEQLKLARKQGRKEQSDQIRDQLER